MIGQYLRYRYRCLLSNADFPYLSRSVIELNDYGELKNVFGWSDDPILLDDPDLYEFHNIEDVNQRKRRDAESLGTVAKNAAKQVCLEIGTGKGYSTAMLATNAPAAIVYTINIPPEEFQQGGLLTTMKLERQDIGTYYRQRGLKNIEQIFANTLNWEPTINQIDLAFIDGSHDTSFVINDTLKVLSLIRPGGFILWHDFNPSQASLYPWVSSVCRGIDLLISQNHLKTKLFHIRDSWIGISQIGN